MTEEEAKTKWCPMVRFYNPNHHDVMENRVLEYVPSGAIDICIGSYCAYWVWETAELGEHSYEVMTKEGRQGHCGLIRENQD